MSTTVRRALATSLALVALLATAGTVLAHPLGNFTINHYAALRVSTTGVALDVVIDQAEIPTFEARLVLDPDGDGELTDQEVAAAALTDCQTLGDQLSLTVDGARLSILPAATGLTFPSGVGGLPTMRLVCQYVAPFAAPLADATSIAFEDASWPERIGWREIVVAGDAVTTTGAPSLAESPSARLTIYPTGLLATPPDVRRIDVVATPGGPALPVWAAPDATPLSGAPTLPAPSAAPPTPSEAPTPPAAPAPSADRVVALGAAVPGGIPDEISSLLAVRELDPLALVGSLLVALALGAAHALSPGHGKTVMAAYLVGSQGTARHALVLGLAVTLSHTLGVLGLAVLVLSATSLVPPERLFPILITASGVLFVGLGGWMLRGQLRARAERRASQHEHEHEHEHAHDHGTHVHLDPREDDGWHDHAGVRHRHVVPGATIGWRSLAALGLAGGLVPSVSALILLLGSLAAGRPAFGIVLIVAFGLGMAVVLAGIGLLLVRARGLVERFRPGARPLPMDAVPILASIVVIGAGVYVTLGAVAQTL